MSSSVQKQPQSKAISILRDIRLAEATVTKGFPEVKVLVVGDVMLDRYLVGTCERISPEAPVQVVKLQRTFSSLGGACNVAANLCALGAQAEIIGLVGKDLGAREVAEACQAMGVGSNGLVRTENGCTTIKTRVLASDCQLLRIDEEVTTPISQETADELLSQVAAAVATTGIQAIILSDYAKGVCTPYFCQHLIQFANQHGLPVYVDPKGTNYSKYAGATGIKPNRAEIIELARSRGWSTNSLTEGAELLRKELELQFVALTLGPEGMVIVAEGELTPIPTEALEVYDVTGAGDTVIATMVAAHMAGLEVDEAFALAMIAAGVVVGHVGSHPIRRDELLVAIRRNGQGDLVRKHCDWDSLRTLVDLWRSQGLVVGFTNGCFDLLHAGHVTLLAESAAKVDRLIVAINSDASVKRLKGPLRPLMSEVQRMTVLSALESVDAVVVFDQDTPLQLVEAVTPDVIIKGGDYTRDSVVGADIVERNGGRVELIPLVPGISTSYLAAAIEKL